MILKVYSIYDSVVQAWRLPLCARAKGEMLRSFSQAVNDPSTDYFKNPGDFTLFELGSFNDENCEFLLYPAPERVVVALELKDVSSSQKN